MSETWLITANIRLEGKIVTQFRETATNEATSIINGAMNDLNWLQHIDTSLTTTRLIC